MRCNRTRTGHRPEAPRLSASIARRKGRAPQRALYEDALQQGATIGHGALFGRLLFAGERLPRLAQCGNEIHGLEPKRIADRGQKATANLFTKFACPAAWRLGDGRLREPCERGRGHRRTHSNARTTMVAEESGLRPQHSATMACSAAGGGWGPLGAAARAERAGEHDVVCRHGDAVDSVAAVPAGQSLERARSALMYSMLAPWRP